MHILGIPGELGDLMPTSAAIQALAPTGQAGKVIPTLILGFIVLMIMKKVGDAVKPNPNNPLPDIAVDLLTLLIGSGIIVTALGQTPLFRSLAAAEKRLLNATFVGAGFGGFLVALAAFGVAYYYGMRFIKQEQWKDLLIFGVAYQGLATFVPFFASVSSWVGAHVTIRVSNGFLAFMTALLNTRFS